MNKKACEKQAPSEVVRALIAAYPDSLLTKDSSGDLPLHLACRERASKSVIGAVLAEEPSAAKVRDDEGRLPIHLACRHGTEAKVVESLIMCYFRGIATPDAYHLLPIHWACAQNASLAVVEALLRANPDSADLQDKWERTPLSLAKASTNPEKGSIIEALNRDPSCWNTHLMDDIESLTSQLEVSQKKYSEAERKIRILEKESGSTIKELKDQNRKLHEDIRVLTSASKCSDEYLTTLHIENDKLKKEIQELKSYAEAYKSMESQRMALLKVTEDMENMEKSMKEAATRRSK